MARHLFSNLRLSFESESQIRGTIVLTLYAADGPPPHPAHPMIVADYDDVYQRGDDGKWRFQKRIITWLFQREGAASPLALGSAKAQA